MILRPVGFFTFLRGLRSRVAAVYWGGRRFMHAMSQPFVDLVDHPFSRVLLAEGDLAPVFHQQIPQTKNSSKSESNNCQIPQILHERDQERRRSSDDGEEALSQGPQDLALLEGN